MRDERVRVRVIGLVVMDDKFRSTPTDGNRRTLICKSVYPSIAAAGGWLAGEEDACAHHKVREPLSGQHGRPCMLALRLTSRVAISGHPLTNTFYYGAATSWWLGANTSQRRQQTNQNRVGGARHWPGSPSKRWGLANLSTLNTVPGWGTVHMVGSAVQARGDPRTLLEKRDKKKEGREITAL